MTSTLDLETPSWMVLHAEIVAALESHRTDHCETWGSREGEIWLRLSWHDRSADELAAIAADAIARGGQLLDQSATSLRAGWQLTEAEPPRPPRHSAAKNGLRAARTPRRGRPAKRNNNFEGARK